MCEVKTVLTVGALLLTATSFCLYQVNSEKKVGHLSEIRSESPCEKTVQEVLFERWRTLLSS